MRDDPALRARNASPFTFAFRLSTFVSVLLAACATSNPKIEAAKRVVDRAEPLRCDIVALEERQARATPGSEESVRLAAELDNARAMLKLHYQSTMYEYIDVMKSITYDERQEVRQYADAVAERCPASRKSEGESRK
jgi:hypothetical protein